MPATPSPPATPEHAAELRALLLAWYDAHGRALPWRENRDPYRVLVSEILLQQINVAQATRHFSRFLAAFPTLPDLAAADRETVRRVWSGMGLYARADRLHRAAQAIGTGVPSDPEALRALPGVGAYIAAAVSSIAFDRPEAAVETNIRRVLARLAALERPRERELAALAASLLDRERPGDWNQALMDLGATVCRPRQPRCTACPLAAHCRARLLGVQASVPAQAPKRPPRPFEAVVVAAGSGGRYLLEGRETRFLHGTRGFPLEAVGDGSPGTAHLRLATRHDLRGRSALAGTIEHATSSRAIVARVFTMRLERDGLEDPRLAPISKLDERVLRLIEGGEAKAA